MIRIFLASCLLVCFIGCAGTQDKAMILSGKFNIDVEGGGVASLRIDADNATYLSFPTVAQKGEEIFGLDDAAKLVEALNLNKENIDE